MVDINHRERFIRAKIVYYGPAAGGKTTNLQVLHRVAKPDRKLELVSINTTQDRTILFDLLPLKTPAFRSYELRFQLVGVPGQRLYAATRKMLLKGADSIVFVANSATDRWSENLESFKEMTDYLLGHGIDPSSLPMIFQYNKRDLPYVTELQVMDRALNGRHSESFPAVAIREEGVLETFAAALRRTMADLSNRYRIGEDLHDARTAVEWTERTMRETFEQKASPAEEPAEPPPSRVVRVSAPSAVPSVASAPPASASAGPTTSAAAQVRDPKAAEALVESYAEAASDLATAVSGLREEREETRRRLEELSAVADVARDLLAGKGAEELLGKLVERIARSLGTSRASFSLLRPDGKLVPVIRRDLDSEPLHGCLSPGGRPLASALVESGKPLLQVAGQPGPLSEAIEKAGEGCSALVAIPLRTPARPLGLLAFYLSQESPVPDRDLMQHLERVGLELALAVEVGSGASASDRLERSLKAAFAGQVAERAMRALGGPLDQLHAAVARLRSQGEMPARLAEDCRQIEKLLFNLKRTRGAVLGWGTGQLPGESPTSLQEILTELEAELREPLARSGIRLSIEVKAGLAPVRAEASLLRGALYNVVENGRNSLAGVSSGGLIRILAEPAVEAVRISIFDNAAALRSQGGQSGFLTWPLERRLAGVALSLVRTVIEHFQGKWAVETREGKGTVVSLLLPSA